MPLADRISPACGMIVFLIGAVVLVGWATGVESLTSIVPGLIPMIPNTATGLVLGGLALWIGRARGATNRLAHVGAVVASVFVLLLGVFTFIERVAGVDFGIDLLFFADQVRRYPYDPPGRMASNSTITFMLAGAALLTVRWKPAGGAIPSRWFATAGLGVAGLALAGYLYDVTSLYRFDRAMGMALPTAIGLFVLHFGILFARPDEGSVSLLTGDDLASRIMRRVLPAAIALPLVFGWLWKAEREGSLLSREMGIAAFAVSMVASLIAVLLKSARVIRDTDRERERVLALEKVARGDADAANRVKDEFLATMSHELRTPLNAIIGYSSLLGEGVSGDLSDNQRAQVRRISMSARHLLTLVEQVLTLSRLEAGKVDVLGEPIDIATVVEEASIMVQPLIAQRGLTFRADVAPGLPSLTTDAAKLRQVLVNLLGNAVKFTEKGEVSITVRRDGGTIRFEVRDTGIGIAPEHLDRIFDPFWQVDSTRTRRTDGTGLGLTVSRQLARAMGGDIVVTARRGEGSTFTLEVPSGTAAASVGHDSQFVTPGSVVAKPAKQAALPVQ